MVNPTPPGHLANYLKGDLDVALRHLDRLIGRDAWFAHYVPAGPLRGILLEIGDSINRCIERIDRDVPPLDQEDDHR